MIRSTSFFCLHQGYGSRNLLGNCRLPADFVEQLRTLEEQLSKSLLPRLESGAEDVELIEGWQGLLKLNTWLNAQEGKCED